MPLNPVDYEKLLRVQPIKGAQATTAIEGNTLSEEEVGQIAEGKSLPPSKKYQEIDEISCRASSTDFASVTLLYSDTNFTSLLESESQVPSTSLSTVTASETAPANTVRGVITLYSDVTAVFDDCAAVEL